MANGPQRAAKSKGRRTKRNDAQGKTATAETIHTAVRIAKAEVNEEAGFGVARGIMRRGCMRLFLFVRPEGYDVLVRSLKSFLVIKPFLISIHH